MKKNAKKKQLTVILDQEDNERLALAAKKARLPVAAYIRNTVLDDLDRLDGEG